MAARTVRFELLRPGEILAEKERYPVVYQPVSPLEWHGPHLPFGTDALYAEAVARRAAEIGGGVVMPTLFWGTERERPSQALRDVGFSGDEWIVGMDFPPNIVKSLYAMEDVFGTVVRARLNLLVRQGYKLIVLVNGHGAQNHVVTLNRLAAEFTAESASRVLHLIAYSPERNDEVGHADAVETSLMMALYPDSVDLGQLPALPEPLRNVDWGVVDGRTFGGNPSADHTVSPENDPRRTASTEWGQAVMAAAADWMARYVRAELERL